ncbi:MAG: NAD(P)/FAD-dependent oxidoreductase, partial [Magnetococcales bacterium]|nr:NAD(P)/FAD-dependent oxidoreductase [Magnetococcales bacterium]
MSSKKTPLVILGAGPGGFAAAIRAANNGIKTVLIDERPEPGGVCLHSGCIPSKALRHVTDVVSRAKEAREMGVRFSGLHVDRVQMRAWKNWVTKSMAHNLARLVDRRKIKYLHGRARFVDRHEVEVALANG